MMKVLEAASLLLLVTGALGAGGGGGHGGSQSASLEGSDDVIILKVPKPQTLICNLTAPEINWLKDDSPLAPSEHLLISSSNLTILDTSTDDVGTYTCQVTGDPSQSRSFDVVTLTYKSLPRSTTALEGDQFSLTCDASGVPLPTVTWMKDEGRLDEAVNGSKVEYRQSEKGLANATIVLSDISQADRGVYTCVISNHPALSYNTSSNVRVKDIYAALWPFLGIVAEVVVLCLVIFIYEKHRAKGDFDESDTDTRNRT